MPGPPTFVIPEVTPAALIPETWSFSGLRDFEGCPRRWALARTPLDCFKGPIPYKPNKSAVEGTLLHNLVEEFASHVFHGASEPFRPRRALLKLIESWTKKNESNPRINCKVLASQIAIENILGAFRQASAHIQLPTPRSAAPYNPGQPRESGAEVSLLDPESKLRGRADLITNANIVDFKTGEPQPEHAEQLLFYASLYLASTRNAPGALTLFYTASGQEVGVPTPSNDELAALIKDARQRVSNAESQLAASDVPAKPEAAKCARCHVRGLCGPYWANRPGEQNEPAQPSIVDYSPSPSASVDRGSQGVYIRDTINDLNSTLYLPQEVAAKMGANIQAIKALALRSTVETSGIRLAFTQFSEIFVTDAVFGITT